MTTVFRAEGRVGRLQWRQYTIVRDKRSYVVEYLKEMWGWKFHHVTTHEWDDANGESWSEARIVAWLRHNRMTLDLAPEDEVKQLVNTLCNRGFESIMEAA